MKKLTAKVSEIILLDNVKAFLLLRFENSNKNMTTLPYDITMSDGNTYLSDNTLKSIDPPRMSTVVDREAFGIVLGDSDFSFRSFFEQGAVGDTFNIKMGFIDPLNNQAITNILDTIIVYKGIIDSHSFNIDFSSNDANVAIEGSSPVSSLDRRNAFYTSKESMRSRFATDSSFDEVHVGSGAAMLKWGKR